MESGINLSKLLKNSSVLNTHSVAYWVCVSYLIGHFLDITNKYNSVLLGLLRQQNGDEMEPQPWAAEWGRECDAQAPRGPWVSALWWLQFAFPCRGACCREISLSCHVGNIIITSPPRALPVWLWKTLHVYFLKIKLPFSNEKCLKHF